MHAGPGSPNVHPHWVELQGTVNSFSVDGLKNLKQRIIQVLPIPVLHCRLWHVNLSYCPKPCHPNFCYTHRALLLTSVLGVEKQHTPCNTPKKQAGQRKPDDAGCVCHSQHAWLQQQYCLELHRVHPSCEQQGDNRSGEGRGRKNVSHQAVPRA